MAHRYGRTLFVAWLIVGGANGVASAQDLPAEQSLTVLTRRIVEHLRSIESLDCEFTVQFDETAPHRKRYVRSGEKWRDSEISVDAQQKATFERVVCSDGRIDFSYELKRQDGRDDETWSDVDLNDHQGRGELLLTPDDLLGETLSNVERSLTQALQQGVVELAGGSAEDADSGRGVVIKGVPTAAASGLGIKYDITAFLDPDHGWLPKQIRIDRNAPQPESSGWKQHWTITEFRQIKDERTGETRWFPWHGELDQGQPGSSKVKIRLVSARINPELPETLFHPVIPAGTEVRDHTRDGKGVVFVQADVMASGEASRRVKAPPTDDDERGKVWPRLALIAAFAGLAAVVAGALRHRRRRGGTETASND